MTEAVKEWLDSFNALSAEEQREATRLLLARVVAAESCEVAEDTLLAAADDLFSELDAREAAGETG